MTNINPQLAGLRTPIAALHADPRNRRRHNVRSLDAIKQSLQKFGQQKPVVALEDGTVIAGNGTLAAAQALGWDALAVVVFSNAADARAYALADNRSAELSEWDPGGLAEELEADGLLDGLDALWTEKELEEQTKAFNVQPGELPELSMDGVGDTRSLSFVLTPTQLETAQAALRKAREGRLSAADGLELICRQWLATVLRLEGKGAGQ